MVVLREFKKERFLNLMRLGKSPFYLFLSGSTLPEYKKREGLSSISPGKIFNPVHFMNGGICVNLFQDKTNPSSVLFDYQC